MKYAILGILVICSGLVWAIVANCDETVNIQPLVVTEQSFADWIDQDFKPVDPMTSYSSKDDSDWTGWNKFWFASAIGAHSLDIVSTRHGLDRGCREGNPLLGGGHSFGVLVLAKVGMLGIGHWLTEYVYKGDPNQQEYRNWLYGGMTVLGAGAASWNSSQDCN